MLRLRWLQSAPRPVQGLLLGVVGALLAIAAAASGGLRGLERGTMDATFQARGARYPSPYITLLVADDASVARANRWPLPWSVHADIVRRLHRAGAKTVAFDFLFSTPTRQPNDDLAFARACRQAGNVVQATAFHLPATYNPSLPLSTPGEGRVLPQRFRVRDAGAQSLSAVSVTAAMPMLQAGAPALGHINVYPEADGALRRIPHLVRYRGGVYPSLALAAATHFLGLKPRDIVAEKGAVRLPVAPLPPGPPSGAVPSGAMPSGAMPSGATSSGAASNVRVPLDENGEAWINWVGRNETFSTYTLNQLFDGLVPPEALRGRLVLVGTTAAGTFEHRATPFSPVQPSIEMQANAIDDILANRPLREMSLLWQALLLLSFAALSGALTAPRRALPGTLFIIGLGFGLWQAAALAMGLANLYVPLAAPLLAGVLTYALATMLNYRREWEANWRADSAMAALARGGALMASVRDRDRLYGVIRQTAREALDAREVLLLLNCEPQTETMRALSQHITQNGQPVLWPPQRSKAARRERPEKIRPTPEAMPEATPATASPATASLLAKQASTSPAALAVSALPPVELSTLLKTLSETAGNAAPAQHGLARYGLANRMRRAPRAVVAAPLPEAGGEFNEDTAREHRSGGALIALGRQDDSAFTARDAALLETLAEQAALALEHLELYERLRGRVELANRDLRDAYAVMAEQSVKLFAAVESIDDALIVSDENGHAIFVNPASRRILGGAAPALGQSVPDALRDSGYDELAALFTPLPSALMAAPTTALQNGAALDHQARNGQAENIETQNSLPQNGLPQNDVRLAPRDANPREENIGANGNTPYGADEAHDGKIVCEVVLEAVMGRDEAGTANDDGRDGSGARLGEGDPDVNTARRVLAAQFTPLQGDAGRSLGAMLVVADVTVQRELDSMKSDFVSYVAHELRTPLTTILGYASLLQDDRGQIKPGQRSSMTEEIVRQCSRLNRMISELLDVSRLDAGRGIVLRRETMDVAELCERVLEGARAALHDPNFVTLEFSCNHRPLLFSADADRLEQVVTNLVSNAVKYSPDGGTVSLELHDGYDAVTLRVADTGMGMTAEQQEHLFQKFYRTSDAQSRGIKGTGLGLFLVKQLVEAHQGQIEVRSEAGKGTVFTVTLPKP